MNGKSRKGEGKSKIYVPVPARNVLDLLSTEANILRILFLDDDDLYCLSQVHMGLSIVRGVPVGVKSKAMENCSVWRTLLKHMSLISIPGSMDRDELGRGSR